MRGGLMAISLVFFFAFSIIAEDAPALVFDGINGYPSSSRYRVEVFVGDDFLIKKVISFAATKKPEGELVVKKDGNQINGVYHLLDVRRVFSLTLLPNQIERHSLLYEKGTNKKLRESTDRILISPRPGVVLDAGNRSLVTSENGEMVIFDKERNQNTYVIKKNSIEIQDQYRQEWKVDGGKTVVKTFIIMEPGTDWMSAGSGVFTGPRFASPDLMTPAINYCILDVVSPQRPTFYPFIFGLHTGE
jgi:hypothetical protein